MDELEKQKLQLEMMFGVNKIIKEQEMQTPEYQLEKSKFDSQMEAFKCAKE